MVVFAVMVTVPVPEVPFIFRVGLEVNVGGFPTVTFVIHPLSCPLVIVLSLT